MDQTAVKDLGERSETVCKKWSGSITRAIKSPPEIVWKLSADFLGMDKYAAPIESCEHVEGEKNEVGCVRLCHGKIWVKEKLISIDHANYSYTYIILDSNLGLERYMATFKVHVIPDGSATVEWSYEAVPIPSSTEEKFIVEINSLLENFIEGLDNVAAEEK